MPTLRMLIHNQPFVTGAASLDELLYGSSFPAVAKCRSVRKKSKSKFSSGGETELSTGTARCART